LVRQDFDVGDPGRGVDRVHELPARARGTMTPIAGDAVTDAPKRASFLVSRWISLPARARLYRRVGSLGASCANGPRPRPAR
jgi:hypothetical protein